MGAFGGEDHQQPQAVAVGGDGVAAGALLSGQAVGEEGLQRGRSCLRPSPAC